MGRARLLLLVEDDTDLRDVIVEVLADEGFRIEAFASAEDALAYLLSSNDIPRLLLVDLLMPGMTGWEFLEEVSLRPRLKELPIIVISGLENPEVPQGVMVMGKPLQVDALLATIRRLSSAQRQRTEELHP